MTNFLCKKFVKDYCNTSNAQVRQSYGKLAGTAGVISNVFLCIVKILAGLVSGSISIIADGINNLSDAASSIVTLIGFRLSSMPEDEEHPYGHARYEYITGLIISIIIIFVGFNLGKSAVEKLLNPSPLFITSLTYIILVISIAVKLWQAYFNFSLGKKIDSTALKATATDSRNDVIATSVILISMLLTQYTKIGQNINLDGLLGIAVAIIVIISGISLIMETSSPLLGEAPSQELVDNIASTVLAYQHVLGIHDLVVHNYGPGKIFASLHVEMDAEMDFMESHDIVDNIERDISSNMGIHFIAHLDPIRTNDPELDKIRKVLESAIHDIDDVYNIHDLRYVPGTTHTNVIFDVVCGSDCKITEKEIIHHVQERIREYNSSYQIVITFDKAYTKL